MSAITPIPAFQDNYIWALHNTAGDCVVVDPGDAAPVERFLQDRSLRLRAILITHHHPDHTGGIAALSAAHDVPVYGPDNPAIRGITHHLGDADVLQLDALGLHFEILAVPGHTLDHIAYYSADDGILLCGDTLFHCGCGRLFEGTPAQMLASLDRLAALPGDTAVYCTHEYTQANMRFAQAVEPDNNALAQAIDSVETLRQQGRPSLPTDIATQCQINPFLRSRAPEVVRAVQARVAEANSAVTVFAALRSWKDQF